MLVDVELREKLSLYCMISKQTQAEAANQAIKEMLERCENDRTIKERMDRAKELKAMLANL